MKQTKAIIAAVALGGLATVLTGCDFMHDDLPDCAVAPEVKTSVRFLYDYNTTGADRFGNDVGSVTLYLFDSEGKFIESIEKRNSDSGNALQDPDFQIGIERDLAPGKYRVYAIAQGNPGGYEASLKGAGAKFRRTSLKAGDDAKQFRLTLDNENGTVINYGEMLDTVWSTLAMQEIEVPEVETPKEGDPQQPDIDVIAKIPLMRLTKHLQFSFYQEDMPGKINASDYEVWIESAQGRETMDITGNYTDGTKKLRYTPYKTWTEKNSGGMMCVHTEFGLSRLMYDASNPDRAKLYVRNKLTGTLTEIDLLPLLADGKAPFAGKKWSDQEYFDREYDFNICDMALADGVWKFATIKVNVLSWSKRVFNTTL